MNVIPKKIFILGAILGFVILSGLIVNRLVLVKGATYAKTKSIASSKRVVSKDVLGLSATTTITTTPLSTATFSGQISNTTPQVNTPVQSTPTATPSGQVSNTTPQVNTPVQSTPTSLPTSTPTTIDQQTLNNIFAESVKVLQNSETTLGTDAQNATTSLEQEAQSTEHTIQTIEDQYIAREQNQENAAVGNITASLIALGYKPTDPFVVAQVSAAGQPYVTAISQSKLTTQNTINEIEASKQAALADIQTNFDSDKQQLDSCISLLTNHITCPAFTSLENSVFTFNIASALCNDGTYSFSVDRSGTCSFHGGVQTWLY